MVNWMIIEFARIIYWIRLPSLMPSNNAMIRHIDPGVGIFYYELETERKKSVTYNSELTNTTSCETFIG